MAYYKLIRFPANGKAVRGRLYEARETRFEEVLIPVCDTIENADYLIPALTYRVAVNRSPKFKRPLPILEQVPCREGIRIHRGTEAKHSKGCILVPPHMEQALTQKLLREQSHESNTSLTPRAPNKGYAPRCSSRSKCQVEAFLHDRNAR